MRLIFLLLTFISVCLICSAPGDTTKVRVHDKVDMTWYANYDEWGVFPDGSESYEKVILHYTMGCASGGCSPWDYTTQIFILHNTGLIDSTLHEDPHFRVDGNAIDSFYYNTDTSYIYFYDSLTQDLDSVPSALQELVFYNDASNTQQPTDTEYVWKANYYNYLFDSLGHIYDSVWVSSETMLLLDYYVYYTPFDVIEKYELARVITPYGGNLSADWEFRHSFDVSDFVHLLRDSVEIRAFYGGWSSGFSATLDFDFIEGIPSREVISIENLYQGSWNFNNAADFNATNFPTKYVDINAAAESVKLRMTPTGHGFDNSINAAEFYAVNYNVKVDGAQVYEQTIWRDDCGENPIYPKDESSGNYIHTWLLDRANWCPGLRAFTYEHDLDVSAGSAVDIDIAFDDYSWSGAQTPSYIVTSELVQYGAINFALDAEVIDIIAPNKAKKHQRVNPVCKNPRIVIRNRGSSTLSSVKVKYGVEGYTSHTYSWTGSLEFLETDTIDLYYIDFTGAQQNPVFFAELEAPNGTADEYPQNNIMRSYFELPPSYPSNFCVWFYTNASGLESSYEITDGDGLVLFSRDSMDSYTYYKDTFNLDTGCYILKIYDRGEDGLDWYFNNDGTGSVKIRNLDGSPLFLHSFNSNFGSSITHYFTVGYAVGIDVLSDMEQWIDVFPNPFSKQVNITFNNTEAQPHCLLLYNMMGHKLREINGIKANRIVLDREELNSGIYFVVIEGPGQRMRMKLVVE